ncbi:MAG: GGDEF domain-containing protein [Desulfobacterales bacterium]|nr:GGDEF domain-containing protein [Desulfobacterales bacterium]
MIRDITDARSARADHLTGLNNRRQSEHEGAHLLGLRNEEPVILIMLDVDHFKAVNDTHGHQAGDEVLRGIAGIMDRICRQSDFAGRWGGEEFVLLLPKTDTEGGGDLAERLRNTIAESPFPGIGAVTVSLGFAPAAEGDTLFPLVERVDDALYRAKNAGRNRNETVLLGGIELE